METNPTDNISPSSLVEPTKADMKRNRVDEALRRNRRKWGIAAAGIVIILGGGIYAGIAYSRRRTADLPGQFFEEEGREHVGPGHDHVYRSNPPVSGPHFGNPADWGVYQEELPDEVLIHNLEHGGVWISYRPGIADDVKKKLEGFYKRWGRKIIVTPRSKNDADVALGAWTRLDTFSVDEFSEERVEKFIKTFRNKGPEFVP